MLYAEAAQKGQTVTTNLTFWEQNDIMKHLSSLVYVS